MGTSIYDTFPAPRTGAGVSWVKWDEPGTTITGIIDDVRAGSDYNGNHCPELELDTTDGTVIVTAGQAHLKGELLALRPEPGDGIEIEYVGLTKLSNGRNMKRFRVEVLDDLQRQALRKDLEKAKNTNTSNTSDTADDPF